MVAIGARVGAIVCLAQLAAACSAFADNATDVYGSLSAAPFRVVEEIRGGAFVDDAVGKEARAGMASLEALSSPLVFYGGPNTWIAAALNPRLDAGVMLNTRGLTSYVFAGVNWRVPLYDRLFGELEFGGAANNSSTNIHDMTRTDLGCPVTFRESAGLGVQLTPQFDLVASIEHISHANLCSNHNPGLTSVGLRLGYKF